VQRIFRIVERGTNTLNVLGNAIAPLVIARWEGETLKGTATERVFVL
jgi:proton glutamate symport protein